MSVPVGRQLRIDEDIQAFPDEQLLSLVWMGLYALESDRPGVIHEHLKRRMEMFRLEVERRGLLDEEMMEKFAQRLSR